MKIVLLGPPGAGKGTQAKRITDAYNIPYLSTGDRLRAAASAETNIGKKVKETMASGKLVPDPLVLAALMLSVRTDRPSLADLGSLRRTMFVRTSSASRAGSVPVKL
jgi:adenylate kinase family enzyme